MVTWEVADTDDGEVIGDAIELTSLRNWAAQLDDDLHVFLGTSPWEDMFAPAEVPVLVAELRAMLSKHDTAPAGAEDILRAMLALAERAARAGRGVAVGG